MPIVKNTSSQALYLNLLDGRTAKIPARGAIELSEPDLQSPSVLHHRTRGVLVVMEGSPAPPAIAPFEKSLLSWETWEPEAQEPASKRAAAEERAQVRKEAPEKREQTVSKSKERRAKASSRKQQGEK